MSVSDECKAGVNDVIYFTEDCCAGVAIDKDGKWDVERSTFFRVGDKVYFLDWFENKQDTYSNTMIKFKAENGKVYSALEAFFVTEDVWEGLKDYFSTQ